MPDTQSRTRITAVARVMVPVTDQDRAIAFYVDKLGFEKISDVPFGEGDRWVEVAPPGSSTAIAFVPERPGTPVGGMSRVIVSSADLDATYTELKNGAVDVDAEFMGGEGPVPRMFFFRDQDANVLLAVEEA
jgi:catechol 2,3-dioxygenase-like lactoylglutathione lyase family enzyme